LVQRVLKFGGSSLADTDRIDAAAERVQEVIEAGVRPIVIVSAMHGITSRLLAFSRRLSPSASGPELDRLLATGEIQVAALLSLALQRRGLTARSFDGGQAGITTDDCHGRARILSVDPGPIRACLGAETIPVVAGFQGVNSAGQITTLGRGGADISAMALGHAHGADRVVIFRDREGVHSTDPKLLALTYRLDKLIYDELIDLAESGTPIVHPQAIEMARAHHQRIVVRGLTEDSEATVVGDESSVHNLPVWSVSLSDPVALISADSFPHHVPVLAGLLNMLESTDLPVDACFQATDSASGLCLAITVPDEEANNISNQLEGFLHEEPHVRVAVERRRRRVALVGKGVASRKVEMAIGRVERRLGPPMGTYRGHRHRGFIVSEAVGGSWLASLHQELIHPG
jgi:aspartate kinase